MEQNEVLGLMMGAGLYLSRNQGKLFRFGLSGWVAKESRKVAAEDAPFKPMAAVVWDAGSGSAGVLHMMNTWGTIDPLARGITTRQVQAGTATAGLFVEARDALLALGAEKWLHR